MRMNLVPDYVSDQCFGFFLNLNYCVYSFGEVIKLLNFVPSAFTHYSIVQYMVSLHVYRVKVHMCM